MNDIDLETSLSLAVEVEGDLLFENDKLRLVTGADYVRLPTTHNLVSHRHKLATSR